MACNHCKKNALKGLKLLKNVLSGKGNKLEKPKNPKTECTKRREKEQDWLRDSKEGKKLSAFAKPNRAERIILILFAWAPLLIGYITIIRFIISLF